MVGACGAFVAVLRNHAEIILAHANRESPIPSGLLFARLRSPWFLRREDGARRPFAIPEIAPRGAYAAKEARVPSAATAPRLGSLDTIPPRFGRLPVFGVGYLGKVPMSKVPILASFDFADILMLTASILVVAAITFVF